MMRQPHEKPRVAPAVGLRCGRPGQGGAGGALRVNVPLEEIRRRLTCQACGRRPERLLVGYQQAAVPDRSRASPVNAPDRRRRRPELLRKVPAHLGGPGSPGESETRLDA